MADPIELRNALLAKLSAAGFDTNTQSQDYWYAIAKALVLYIGSVSTTDHRVLTHRSDANQHPASSVSTSTTNFIKYLSSSDTDVQKALETLDKISTDDHFVKADSTDTNYGALADKIVSDDDTVTVSVITDGGVKKLNLTTAQTQLEHIDRDPRAGTVVTGNLIVNPGAELGPGDGGVPTGWTRSPVGCTACMWSSNDHDPDNDTYLLNADGDYVFYGGPDGTNPCNLIQNIDISEYTTGIDTGDATYVISGRFGGHEAENDTAGMDVTFLNGSGGSITSYTIGNPDAGGRGSVTSLVDDAYGPAAVSVLTRTIRVTIAFTAYGSGNLTGYADTLSLILSIPLAPLERDPGTIVLQHDGGDPRTYTAIWVQAGPSQYNWQKVWPQTPGGVTVHNDLTDRDEAACHPASAVTVDTALFNNRLSASDSVVQTALETLDQADDVGVQLGSFRVTGGEEPPYGYDLSLILPQDDKASYMATPDEKSTIINNTTGFVELATACSSVEGTGVLRWLAGHWRVNFLAKITELVPAPNGTSYIRVSVAKRTVSAESDIGWTNYDVPILGTSFASYSCYRILEELNVSAQDCILVRFYAWTNSINLVEITLGYDDANGYTRIETPVCIPPVGRVLPASGNAPSKSLYDALDVGVDLGLTKSLSGSVPDQKVALAVQASTGSIYHARQTVTSYATGYNHGSDGTWFDVCTATGFSITAPCDVVAKATLSGKCTQTDAICRARIVIDYGEGYVGMVGGTAAFKTSSVDGDFTLAVTGLAIIVVPATYNCSVKLQITTDSVAEFYISPGGANNSDAAALIVTEYATDSYGTIVRLGGAITGNLNVNLGGPGLNDSVVPKVGRAVKIDTTQYSSSATFSLSVVGYMYSQLGTSVGVVELVETSTRTVVSTLYINGTTLAAFTAPATLSATPKIYELRYALYTSPTPQPGDVVFLSSADLTVNSSL